MARPNGLEPIKARSEGKIWILVPKFLRRILLPLKPYYYPYIVKQPPIDPEFRQVVEEITKDDTVIEIGSNVGGATIPMAQRARWVIAIEPNPQAFKTLKQYVRKFKLKNVKCLNYAVSDKDGTATLNLGDKDPVKARNASIRDANYSQQSVQVRTLSLDDLNEEASVLIMDCKGVEKQVIIGGAQTLKRARKCIIENSLAGAESTKALMSDNNYSIQKEIPFSETALLVFEKQS